MSFDVVLLLGLYVAVAATLTIIWFEE